MHKSILVRNSNKLYSFNRKHPALNRPRREEAIDTLTVWIAIAATLRYRAEKSGVRNRYLNRLNCYRHLAISSRKIGRLESLIIGFIIISSYQELNFFFFFQGDHTLSRKKIVRKSPHSWAGCIVEPYNASRQPIHRFWPKWVMVVTLMCVTLMCVGVKHCKCMASYTNIWGNLKGP